jgi:hypothetical protein
VRLTDLIVALLVLAALVWIARKEFPAFDERSVPRPVAAAPTPAPSPAAAPEG